MKTLPTENRPSTKILQDLISVRRKLMVLEGSNEPFISRIDPLLERDKQLSECLVQYLIYELDLNLKEEVNSKILPKQTHEDRKSPINVKSLKSFHRNALADTTIEIKIRPIIVLILLKFLPFQRILLAIGSMKAKIITKGVSDTS